MVYLGWALLDIYDKHTTGQEMLNEDATELVAIIAARALIGMSRL